MELLTATEAHELIRKPIQSPDELMQTISSNIRLAASSGCSGLNESFDTNIFPLKMLGALIEKLRDARYEIEATLSDDVLELIVSW